MVLTEGEIHWSNGNGDFDWGRTDALPKNMAGIFSEEPLFLDLRWAGREKDLSLNHPQFREAVSDLSATLRGASKDELIGADILFHRRAMQLAWSAAGALLILMLLATGAAIYANRQKDEALYQRNLAAEQRDRAEKQSNIATARQLAAQSQLLFTQEKDELERSVLLAIESNKRFPSYEAGQSLCLALSLLPRQIACLNHDYDVSEFAFSSTGKVLATSGYGNDFIGSVSIWNVAEKIQVTKIGPVPAITALAISDDQRCVAGAGLLGTGVIWCADGTVDDPDSQWTPAAVTKNDQHPQKIFFTRDNRYVVILAGALIDKKSAQIFDAENGKLVVDLSSKAGARDMDRNASGTLVAVGGKDNYCRIWDTGRRITIKVLSHDGEVVAVRFDQSGKRLVTVTKTGTVYTWLTGKWKMAARTSISAAPKKAAISADARYVAATTDDGTVGVWHRETGKSIFSVKVPEIHFGRIVFSSDSAMLALWGELTDHVQIWDVFKKKEIARIPEYQVSSVVFSPDNTIVATAGTSIYDRASLWDHTSTLASFQDKYDSMIQAVQFSSKGNYLAAGTMDGKLQLNDLSTNQVWTIDIPGGISRLGFSQDEKYIATGDYNGVVQVWETAKGNEAGKFELDCTGITKFVDPSRIVWLNWSSNGRYIAAGCSADVAIVWDMQENKRIGALQKTSHMSFHPDRELLAICGVEGGTRIVECGSWQDVEYLSGEEEILKGVFSKSGRYFATTGNKGNGVVWRTSDWRRINVFYHGDQCNLVRFSDDEHRLATAGSGFARVWEISTGNLFVQMNQDSTIHDLEFGPAGNYLLTASNDNYATVWQVSTGKPVLHLPHASKVTTLDLSPNFKYLVTGSEDQTVRAWYWQPEDLMTEACDRLARNLTHDEWDNYINDGRYRKTCPDLPTDFREWLNFTCRSCQSGKQVKAEENFRALVNGVLDTKDTDMSNEICWAGSLWGFAKIVLPACNHAVGLADPGSEPYFRDSRGVAQAMLGDLDKAIMDFQAFVNDRTIRENSQEMVTERERWIDELTKGENPFTKELLETMRKESGC